MLAEYNVIKRPVNSEAYVSNEEFYFIKCPFLFCETGIDYIAMHGITRNRMWEAIASHVRHLTGFSALAPKKLSYILKPETLTHASPEEVASIWENVSSFPDLMVVGECFVCFFWTCKVMGTFSMLI